MKDQHNRLMPPHHSRCFVFCTVESSREVFMIDALNTHNSISPHQIKRQIIYSEVMNLYRSPEFLHEFPFRIQYENEKAVDTGGVCRDMLSCFWEECYRYNFDGEKLLLPLMRPDIDMTDFRILGTILSHGFMSCGFLPVRIAFPVIAAVLLGPDIQIADNILIESFCDFLASYESSKLQEAVTLSRNMIKFDTAMKSAVIDILSRYECTVIPTSDNIKQVVTSVAKHLMVVKQLGAVLLMRTGVPTMYNPFWQKFSVDRLYGLYKALNATVPKVLQLIKEPSDMATSQNRVFNYLLTFIGNMKPDELRLFLRFVTGSSVLLAKNMVVSFNHATGLLRAPRTHTCSCGVELSVAYSTYPEFEKEFYTVLHSDLSWVMDKI